MAKKRTRKKADPLGHIVADLQPLAREMGEFRVDPNNAREHSDEDVAGIASSLTQYKQRTPLVVNRATGLVIKGNGTYLAAERLGWGMLAAVYVTDDESTATGYALADNRAAELSRWNDDRLAELLPGVQETNPDQFDALLFSDLLPVEIEPATTPEKLDTSTPAELAWCLIGIPAVRFVEIAETIDVIAALDGAVVETTLIGGRG